MITMHAPSFIYKFIITASLFALSFQAQAQQWYHVELIVFEQLNIFADEKWPETPLLETAPLNAMMATALIQPANNESLISAAQRLNRSPRYRVHYHQAWQQPILEKATAQAVAVQSEDALLDGHIRLYKATYLHAQLDLWLMESIGLANSWSDASPEGIDISAPRNPNLNESRRIRSKKLYFFDHPKLGALLQLTPIDTPASVDVDFEQLETFSLPNEGNATVTE
jgi:peptidoglycan-binding protein CsiV